jgi:hypothetical protein
LPPAKKISFIHIFLDFAAGILANSVFLQTLGFEIKREVIKTKKGLGIPSEKLGGESPKP